MPVNRINTADVMAVRLPIWNKRVTVRQVRHHAVLPDAEDDRAIEDRRIERNRSVVPVCGTDNGPRHCLWWRPWRMASRESTRPRPLSRRASCRRIGDRRTGRRVNVPRRRKGVHRS